MLHDWKMVTTLAMLHSNGQLRTGKDGDTEKGSQKPVLQQKTTELNCFNSLLCLKYSISKHNAR